jgi:hypothetical protein
MLPRLQLAGLLALAACGQSNSASSPIGSLPSERPNQITADASPIAEQHKQSAEERAADVLVKNFIGYCVQTMPHIDKVETAARALKWQEAKGDEAALLAPKEPGAWFRAWMVELEPGVAMLISVARGKLKNQDMAICAVANPYAPSAPILTSLQGMLKLSAAGDFNESSGGQRYITWAYPNLEPGTFIASIDATPMREPGITLSVSSPILQ